MEWKDFLNQTHKEGEWSLLAQRYHKEEFYGFLDSIEYQTKLDFLLEVNQEQIEYFNIEGKEYAHVNDKVYIVPSLQELSSVFIEQDSEYFHLFANFLEKKERYQLVLNAYISYISTL